MPIEVPELNRNCPFCNYIGDPSRFATVEALPETVAFLPPRQSGKGHVLVIPKRHAPTLLDLEHTEALAIMRHVHRIAHALSKAFDPSGLNVFQNNGVVAGQTVPHYHVHIVPSYPGDLPGRIFSSEGTERMERDELQKIADEIAAYLEPIPSGVSS
ncbi:MAG TPA: HIT family protein [Chloroflexota bacterium]|jgi:histidine triad (HIT) family protein